MNVKTLVVSYFLNNILLAHKGRSVAFLKDSSNRKRRKFEVEDVKEEEAKLHKDK